MSEKFKTYSVFALLLMLALAFRLPQLAERPMHGDEANQAYRAGILYDTGVYEYDPHEHHGPTLYYFALPFLWLSGADDFKATTEYPYRLEIVFFGVGLILLLWLVRDALGLPAVLVAGGLMAVSPVMVYYSRYFIQETLLIFFAFAAIACGWRYFVRPHWAWAVLAGLNLGLVHATKETSIIIFAAMGGALFLSGLAAFYKKDLQTVAFDKRLLQHAFFLAGAALAVVIVLYSSFFTHWRGPLDSILTYTTYLSRAEGAGSAGAHDKPWHYYLGILLYSHREAGPVWSEAMVVVGAFLGMGFTVFRFVKHKEISITKINYFYLFISFYFLLLTVIYSLIPYKTPWNLLPFYHPMVLLAGIFITTAIVNLRRFPLFIVVYCLLILSFAQMIRLSHYTNFVYEADTRNPYVYAHTSSAIMRLIQRLEDLGKVSGMGNTLPVHILKPDGDYWPLPWYLRQYERVGYWPALPEPLPPGKVFITDTRNAPLLMEKLGPRYISEVHGLRPNLNLVAFIERELWDKFMQTRQ